MSAYETLKARWHRAGRVDEAMGILGWDQAVMMPSGGAQARGEQMATLAVLRHEMVTQGDTQDLITAAKAEALNAWDAKNLALIEREWAKAALLPTSLVAALSEANASAENAWGRARDANDFALVRDALAQSFALTKERAQLLGEAFGAQPYDMLLDDFEPGLTAVRVQEIFADYSAFLPDFLAQVQARQTSAPVAQDISGPFATTDQAALGQEIARTLGFDFSAGRLDVSRHPFSGGHPRDVRITTRYDVDDFTTALMGVIHETGHGLYEAGLPEGYLTQPVGRAAGLAAHESQSLLFEMQACRSDSFLSYLAPIVRAQFDGKGVAWSQDNLRAVYRRVSPGLVRVDADEVTYPAHVILRFELEQALFDGSLSLADLPLAFADGLEAKLGVRPDTDFQGVLQDIHWYSGGFGYFPTYTLGAMAAAQLFAAAKADRLSQGGNLDADLAAGDFAPLLTWLRAHVHGVGSLYTTDEMLTRATGSPLDPGVFKAHLRNRYLGDVT